MPNWCDNNLTINGSYKELKRFYETAKGRGLHWDESGVRKVTETKGIRKHTKEEYDIPTESIDFSQFMFPVGVKGSFHDVGYHWCCDNWGTKWNACDSFCNWDEEPQDEETDELFYWFNTAWSPISEFLINSMQELFPTLKFNLSFSEGGMGFYGGYDDENGYLSYDFPTNEDIEDLFDRLINIGYFNTEECNEEYSIEDYRSDCVCDLYDKFTDIIADDNEEKTADDLYDYLVKEMLWEQSKKKGEDLYASGNEKN